MKRFRIGVVLLAIAGTFAAGRAIAQHEQHPAGPQAGSSPGMTAPMPGGMNMGQSAMGGMMCPQQDVQQLTEQILKSFAALENETDPAALQRKLGEHGAYLKLLQSKVQAGCPMMAMMGSMSGSTMGPMPGPTTGPTTGPTPGQMHCPMMSAHTH